MTDTTLAKTEPAQLALPQDISPGALIAALTGDIGKLNQTDQAKYLVALCESCGRGENKLNVLSNPFNIISLKGKLTVYANKGCAEQLRNIHEVNIEIVERKVEHGVYMVRVKAKNWQGRVDENIGAVPFDEKMNPEDKANAMMKCETKAKRRVTLSICGLGMMDESELDQVKHAKTVTEVVTTDSASAIAEELNALNAKPKMQDAEIVPEKPKAEPVIGFIHDFEQPEPVQTQAAGELSPADKMARELETVLSGYSSKVNLHDCIGYCIRQAKMPADTKDLGKIDAAYGAKILGKPATFISAVEIWLKGGKK